MNILLLITALATFAAWLAGIFMTVKGKASDFQAHSSKFVSVLSKVYLGREALTVCSKRGDYMKKSEDRSGPSKAVV